MKLNEKALALSGGIMWGFGLAILTLISVLTGYGTEMLNILVKVYPGYAISYLGALIGLVYGFLDAFIGLYIFAWLYNKIAKQK